jgi:hypothetical protein
MGLVLCHGATGIDSFGAQFPVQAGWGVDWVWLWNVCGCDGGWSCLVLELLVCRVAGGRLFAQSTLLLTLRPSCSAPMPEMTSWTRCLNCACTSSDS